jgi:hypothetical protein
MVMGLTMALAGGSVWSQSAPSAADFSAGYPSQQASQALYDEMDYAGGAR